MKTVRLTIDDLARLRPAHPDVRAALDRVAEAVMAGSEAALQRACEQWLDGQGYWRRTPKSIAAGKPPRGWQIHVAQARGNPLLLDLLLLGNDGRFLEVELKTATGRIARHQQQLGKALGVHANLARSLEDFIQAVRVWELRGWDAT